MNANLNLDLSGQSLPVFIDVRHASLGGDLAVHRALPTRWLRSVGHWCFLDHMGPAEFSSADEGLHVGAHPHIGLQTFTWMIEGEILHRDSLGNEQVISAGQVNLMTAGHGISHTEDSVGPLRKVHGAQLWIALPEDRQDIAPAFSHHPRLPVWREGGCQVTVMAGGCGEHVAPVPLHSPLLGVDVTSEGGGQVRLPLRRDFEYALMVLRGRASVRGENAATATDTPVAAEQFVYWPPGEPALSLQLAPGSQVILLGGVPLAKRLTIWWNFVAFDRERIRQAWHDWENGSERFGRIAGMEHTRIAAPPLVL
ncbi:hypothetical protein CCO03_01735 [Comamonas serinivorans]|uniref:Quercetin 2,3-dioxygenase n=1 Tax=Comamonas serinivorans TaxID=1082851 RepID=A0A1Y0EIV9_9BURK|nr:pirin family protein [Comamonas serinivorans]ARU03575.1 hypothetical protein CCO03_01735 [Comamonas serinivorans]